MLREWLILMKLALEKLEPVWNKKDSWESWKKKVSEFLKKKIFEYKFFP